MKCVVQFFMKPDGFDQPVYNNLKHDNELFVYSVRSVKEYAKQCGADYQLIDTPRINHVHPTFERYDLWLNDAWWHKYTHILYLDTDVIVWPDAPNIFAMYPDQKSFKPCDDRLAHSRSPEYHERIAQGTVLEKYDGETLQQQRFNAGVFMLTQSSAQVMRPHVDVKSFVDDDNMHMIDIMLQSGVAVEYMDARFNKKMGITSWFGHAYGQDKHISNNKVISQCRKVFR